MTFKEFWKSRKNLKESPDTVHQKNLYHTSKEAFPFGYFNGQFYFDKQTNGKTHFQLLKKFLDNGDQNIRKVVERTGYLDSTKMKFHGRLWLLSKVISFWNYPDKQNFEKVINDLKKSGIKIDNTWSVEVKSKEKTSLENSTRLIPIDQYQDNLKGSNKKEELLHIMDPISKEILKKSGKISSPVQTDLKIPKGMTMAQYNNMKMTSENLHEVKDDSSKSRLAKILGLTHVGKGTYEKNGIYFRWDGNKFEKVSESLKNVKAENVLKKPNEESKFKEIDSDSEEILKAFKEGGMQKASEKFNSLIDSKKLVYWVQIALKEKSYKLIQDYQKSLKEDLDESSKSEVMAKQANLEHVGHGIYKSKEGKKFVWTGASFKPIDEEEGKYYIKQSELRDEVNKASEELKKFDKFRGPTGLTPDHIKNTPEWKKAKIDYNIAVQNLGNYNSKLTKYEKSKKKKLKEDLDENVPTTVAPTSVQTGQYAGKPTDIGKRKEPQLINDIKDRVKKKLKDKYSKIKEKK